MIKDSRRHLPQSRLGQAIDYTLGQWPMLGVYLRDGRIEIDNNLVENAIRPTAIGKKNWLFIGEAQAGQRGAIIYTIIESLPPPWHRSLGLSARRAHPPADAEEQPNLRSHSSSLGKGSDQTYGNQFVASTPVRADMLSRRLRVPDQTSRGARRFAYQKSELSYK